MIQVAYCIDDVILNKEINNDEGEAVPLLNIGITKI